MRAMKELACAVLVFLFSLSVAWAQAQWEKQGNFYYLTKTRGHFAATGAGANKFTTRYLVYDGIEFLVRGADGWRDYGRLDLEGNAMFSLPIRSGMKVDEVYFLAGGNYGNSYEHDPLLRLYGDNYYYATVSVTFAYQDGAYQSLSVPVFWDWFRLRPVEWSKDGARIKYIGLNPVRKDCGMSIMSFANPRPAEPVKDILVSDSWLSDRPFSEIFAVTLKSSEAMEALLKADRRFEALVTHADKEPVDTRAGWMFDNDLDGWVAGCSENWDSDAYWLASAQARKGVAVIPACNWAGDKFSWIEKKVALPARDKVELQFLRQSSRYSEFEKKWSDGLLKVVIKAAAGPETVYEKLYSGQWISQTADLSRFKGQTVIIRFENHAGGVVRLSPTSAPGCDAEDALIDDVRLSF